MPSKQPSPVSPVLQSDEAKPSLHPSSITLSTFKDLLSQYPKYIPEKLTALEKYRMQELPKTLAARKADSIESSLHLTKDELSRLVEWKLKHGTFRPKLLSLVQSNLETEILKTTSSAFSSYLAQKNAFASAQALTSLKGIGIATASLIMSVLDGEQVPFFGDEVFRWCNWDESANAGKGWARKIGYTAKEYRRFGELAKAVRERLGVGALEVEMVGYILGKTKADVDGGEGEIETDAEKIKAESNKRKADVLSEDEEIKSKPQGSKKGKVENKAKEPVETTRITRSTRSSTKRRHSE